MLFFDNKSNFRDVVNNLNYKDCKDYKRLNVVLLRNQLTINNTSQIDKLRQFVYLNLQIIQECEETIYILLIAFFYFELSCILSLLSKNQICCFETIQCCLLDKVIMKLLEQIYSSCLFFVTHSRVLRYYFDKRDLCLLY